MKNEKVNNFLPPYVIFAIIPLFWIITLGITFVIDTIILSIIILLVYKKVDFATYKKTILKIWLLGFSTYFIGSIYLYIVALLISNLNTLVNSNLFGEINSAINQSHFDSIWGLIYVISGILISSIFIFVFNYYISFKKTDFTKKQRIASSLAFSVATAPYFFLLPNTFSDYISTYINLYDFSIFSIF